jgi:hypothetical protein
MEIIEEAARIGGFHDDLTVAVAIFDDAGFLDRALKAGVA